MSIDVVLARLDKVRQTSRDSWVACCPAHADRSPSLSVSEKGDGRVLVYCHALCTFDEILATTGLLVGDFFAPDTSAVGRARERSSFNPRDTLKAIAFEVTTVRMIAAMMKREGRLSDGSQARLGQAMARLMSAEELINGC